MESGCQITSVVFQNFKAFSRFSLSLKSQNLLVGPNNAGKSTIIGAFRVLAASLRRARARGPELLEYGSERNPVWCYPVARDDIPISLENASHDYSDDSAVVRFRVNSGDQLELLFENRGNCKMRVDSEAGAPRDARAFKKRFPLTIGVVPPLGPVEHEEELLERKTIQAALTSHRASRHFRNFWYYNPDQFDDFASLVRDTWEGMQVRRPEVVQGGQKPQLTMFCSENRFDRELYWVGSGFQIWCQLLTHILRCSKDSLIVVDEPEVYLHPDMQRQLLGLFRSLDPSLLLATHSSEIMAEADPGEILLINKRRPSAERLATVDSMQSALDYLGSSHNLTLAQLARNRRVLFVEGEDFKLLRLFAGALEMKGLEAGSGIVPVPVGGYGRWQDIKALGWGIERTLGRKMLMSAVFDRDFFCDEEIQQRQDELRKELAFVAFHRCKEIENYLLDANLVWRAVAQLLRKRRQPVPTSVEMEVFEIVERKIVEAVDDLKSEYLGKYSDFHRSSGQPTAALNRVALDRFQMAWNNPAERWRLVSGKKVLSAIGSEIQTRFGVSLTKLAIVRVMSPDEMDAGLREILIELESFRRRAQPD